MRHSRAFTIIELLFVILILALLATAAAVRLSTVREHSRDTRRLGDVLLIAKVIEQSVVVNRGSYPTNAQGGSVSRMCAQEMYSSDYSANPNNLDLTIFSNRQIPVDPQAATPLNVGCTGMNNGYTYHTHFGTGPSLAINTVSTNDDYVYVLEVGLEREKPIDDTTFRQPSQIGLGADPTGYDSSTKRYRYLLPGQYCDGNCY